MPTPSPSLPHPTEAAGVCLGASTISLVRVRREPGGAVVVVEHGEHAHRGDPRGTLTSVLAAAGWACGIRMAATGRKFRHLVRLTSIAEPEAVEVAYQAIRPAGRSCPAVVSAGGETFMAYVLDGGGRIRNVVTGNKCASGTGEFFLQQLDRMDASLEQAASWAATATASARSTS